MTMRIGVMADHHRAAIAARVQRVCEAARVPGALVAVVTREAVLLTHAFGVADLAAEAPMRAGSRYPIASTTKALTATLIDQLVGEGLLDWDVPVRHYWPAFRLQDDTATRDATLRDLVAMRSGLPRHDWTWIGADLARAELVRRLAWLAPSCGFRERFQYNNLTVTAAAHVAEHVTGETWETLVHRRVLTPLGMTGARCDWADDPTIVSGHHETPERTLVPTPRVAAAATGPSGGALVAGIADMTRWAQFNLGDGRPLLQPGRLSALHAPQVMTGGDPAAPSPSAAYALGWFVDSYCGMRRVSHGGYLADVNSEIALYPKRDLAILTVTNFGAPRAARLLAEEVFDAIDFGLDGAGNDSDEMAQVPAKLDGRSEAAHDVRNEAKRVAQEPATRDPQGDAEHDVRSGAQHDAQHEAQHEVQHEAEPGDRLDHHLADYEARIAERLAAVSARPRVQGTQPSHPLPAYAGRFTNDGYGTLAIDVDGDTLIFQLNAWRFELAHWHYDAWTFAAAPGQPLHAPHPFDADSLVQFDTGDDGEIAALSITLEPAVAPIRFRRALIDKDPRP